MANWNIKQSYDFNKVPGGAKRHEKVQERVLTNFGSRHKSSYLGIFTSRNFEGIPNSKFTMNCKKWKTEFSFDFGGRTCFGFCSKEMWSLSFRTKLKTLYDQVHNLTIVFSITIGIRLFYNISGWLLDACINNKLLFWYSLLVRLCIVLQGKQ